MPPEIHSFVEDSDDFHAIFDENIEDQMLVNVMPKQSWHDFLVFLVQIGRVIGNVLAGFYQLVIV